MDDRRRHERIRGFEAATITYGDDRTAIDGVVRNASDVGALLLVDEPRRPHGDLELTVARGGVRRRARIVWRGETALGVLFATDAPIRTATIVSLAEARRIRSQIGDAERLAARVARIARPQRRPRPHWIAAPLPDGWSGASWCDRDG